MINTQQSIRQRGRAWPLLLVTLLVAGVAVALREQWIRLPANSLPWETPDLAQPVLSINSNDMAAVERRHEFGAIRAVVSVDDGIRLGSSPSADCH
jgi:hypothetical protein